MSGTRPCPKLYPNVTGAFEYADDIIAGRIVANSFIKGACKRFLREYELAHSGEASYYFDPEPAERYLRLVQKFNHVKGRWDNPKILYENWQKWIFTNIHGFISKETGERRFRTAYIEVARGNAKSTMCSQAGLFSLSLDNPVGNEVYSAATKKEQARIVLDAARSMAKKNQGFCDKTGTKVRAHEIIHESSDSFFRALSSDGKSLDGLLPALAIIDELHAHKTREVYDVIDSGMSKRKDSLLIIITTAGFDESGIGYSQSNYAKKIASGELEDDTYFSAPYCLEETDNPKDETTWIKANPNLGVSVDLTNLRAKFKKALQDERDYINFKTKHLNIWTTGTAPFFNKTKLNLCIKKTLKLEDFYGERCRMAVDLASTRDITAVGYVFKRDKNYFGFCESFLPEETLRNSKMASYAQWEKMGWLISTPGASINLTRIQDHVRKRVKQIGKVEEILFDPWHAREFAQRMTNDRIAEMVQFAQTTKNYSEPMKRLDALILEGQYNMEENEVLKWSLGNVTARVDNNENVFPRKHSEEQKIDPALTQIMALAGWITEEADESVYQGRGLIII